jgi:carbonic anhydrase/acetyltransferase-like protein (isoleucine patch superfamily)
VNVQDGAVIHGTFNKSETRIDEGASIGHNATVHGAHVQAGALIGMNAVVLDGAVIGEHAVIAAGAVVLEGTVVPPRTLWAGVPAKQRGKVRPELQEHLAATADRYVEYAGWFNR